MVFRESTHSKGKKWSLHATPLSDKDLCFWHDPETYETGG